MRERLRNVNLWVLALLVAVAVGTSGLSLIANLSTQPNIATWVEGWLQNFSTEIFGAIVTFVLFELLLARQKEMRQEKLQLQARLVLEAGSGKASTAVREIEKLRYHEWLTGDAGTIVFHGTHTSILANGGNPPVPWRRHCPVRD